MYICNQSSSFAKHVRKSGGVPFYEPSKKGYFNENLFVFMTMFSKYTFVQIYQSCSGFYSHFYNETW